MAGDNIDASTLAVGFSVCVMVVIFMLLLTIMSLVNATNHPANCPCLKTNKGVTP